MEPLSGPPLCSRNNGSTSPALQFGSSKQTTDLEFLSQTLTRPIVFTAGRQEVCRTFTPGLRGTSGQYCVIIFKMDAEKKRSDVFVSWCLQMQRQQVDVKITTASVFAVVLHHTCWSRVGTARSVDCGKFRSSKKNRKQLRKGLQSRSFHVFTKKSEASSACFPEKQQ